MNKPNQIDSVDEGLRMFLLESSQREESPYCEQTLDGIFTLYPVLEMSASKKMALLTRLQQDMALSSFGQLLSHAVSSGDLSDAIIIEKTGLSSSMIEELKQDVIYPNNVPVMLFKRLLTALNISFQSAASAMRQTFDLLQSRSDKSFHTHLHPSYKKGNYVSKDSLLAHTAKSDGKELFQNEEAFTRYLNRLEHLMNH